MKPAAALLRSVFVSGVFRLWLFAGTFIAAAFAGGCSNSMSSEIVPPPQNTAVVIMASSTANAQLSQMTITFSSLTLTGRSGKSVTVFSTPQSAEFIHLNGAAEPLFTASIPSGVYTSASAAIPSLQVVCVMQQSNGGLLTDEFQSNVPPVVTLSMPGPIDVTGSAMGLLLDLQVSQSVMPANCPLTPNKPTVNAAFNLTPITLAAQPATLQNGKLFGLQGLIASVNSMSNSFTVTGLDGPTWSVQSNSNTVFQGVAAFSTLAAGIPVDFDAALQSDGSLLATRVEVQDANPSNLTVSGGPLLFVDSLVPALTAFGLDQQGFLFPAGRAYGPFDFSFGNATFQTSGRFANLQNLPFSASFAAANMFAGQSIFFTSHSQTIAPEPTYAVASSATLMPQTINGVITASGSAGAFTTYTVSLASYDLIPNLAVQPGQTTIISNPSTVIVYVDGNTQMLNKEQLAVGSTFRFNGLLFNDNGTLRMDAGQINDGVAQ